MRTKTRGTCRLALLLGLIAVAPAAGAAAQPEAPASAPEPSAVRVINNYLATVKVYVEDADGRQHRLGQVARGKVELLEIPEEITSRGTYRIKIFPNEPLWAAGRDDFGIRTRDIALADGQVLNFWLEPDLVESRLEVTSS